IFYLILNKSGLKYYLYSMYISYLISFAVAFVLSYQLIDSFKKPVFHDFIKMFKYGVVAQLASIFQLLNYRLAYYLIDIFIGRASLGVFSAATQICEGLWIFGKSIATVLFVNISNSTNLEQSRALSKRLLKFTLTVTFLPLLVLMFLPSSFYINFLGDSFGNVPFVIRWLSVGTLSLSGSAILSTYFSGSGKIRINTYGSGLGMIVTLVAGFVFVPFFGMNGAALVNTLSYFTSLLFLIYHFKKEGEISINDFILTKSDVIEVLGMLTSKIKKG
ncbi:MAG TPA: polysaccharide biosynthesis C-terminal domain-containing protein, partial [Ignavibacteriaceae bacterium]